MVAPRAIEDVYRRAHTVMRVQQELRETIHETPVAPNLKNSSARSLPKGKRWIEGPDRVRSHPTGPGRTSSGRTRTQSGGQQPPF